MTQKSDVEERLEHAAKLSLEMDKKSLEKAENEISEILEKHELTQEEKLNAIFLLGQIKQKRGQHKEAIMLFSKTQKEAQENQATIIISKFLLAVSYSNLKNFKSANHLFEECINHPDVLKNEMLKATLFLEYGTCLDQQGKKDDAEMIWKNAAELYRKLGDISHLARVESNLAGAMLSSPDIKKQEEGVELIEAANREKALLGDLEGLATNFCNLGLYYWRASNDFKRALCYLRKDLKLTEEIGNKFGTVTSLMNLSELYRALNQIGSSRKCLKRAKKITTEIGDEKRAELIDKMLNRLNSIAKELIQNKTEFGFQSKCVCGSGEKYIDCCGKADHEPVDLPFVFGGVAPELEKILEEAKASGVTPIRLDRILRLDKSSKQRLSFLQTRIYKGFFLEVTELPDMANLFLWSAKKALEDYEKMPDNIYGCLNTIILSCCALEAFANQLSFFIAESKTFVAEEPKFKLIVEGKEFTDPLEFQTALDLAKKWRVLSEVLCGHSLESEHESWQNFLKLVQIRNELIHFKSAAYEKIIPKNNEHQMIKLVSGICKPRDVPRSWPFRILTPELARWAVATAEKMIDTFKIRYKTNRGYK